MKKINSLINICFAAILLIQGCKCNRKAEKKDINTNDSTTINTEDSVQMIHDFSLEDSANIFKINSQQWLGSILKNNTANWTNFHFKSQREIDAQTKPAPFTPPKDFYKNYQSVLRWSSDSSFIIDFGSYGSMTVKDANGNNHLEGSDPDTKVALINVAKQQQSQILFAGPSTKILDVKWLSNSEALMLFSEEGENNSSDTLLWLIDIPRNLIRQYQYH
ncbi:hypothetical protein [Arachidicoccus soli]|jgi:hypothetical protein|uniref:Lipoprotein n=1 Tax=Arachidicoccus soli TaxID=2341117 RepID=A0A386HL14_9BACT|nr:hypothetical protein [Arachidicoccus soli]AYD46181.1 hypothetical protein D6B99_00230 [Arachidicoccus soli]